MGPFSCMEQLTVAQIRTQLRQADEERFCELERSLAADTPKGVRQAVAAARARLDAQAAEAARLDGLYDFQGQLMMQAGAEVALGLDEVGRGPLAGPLAVGAVVLPLDARIEGLDDSKRLSEDERVRITSQVKERASAWTLQYASVEHIDTMGIATALRDAFVRAIAAIEAAGVHPDLILLDGNPLGLDAREVSVVKGDARVAAIAAASVLAKVDRDALMDQMDERYPGYGFAQHKGYGTAAHTDAIRRLGLSPLHRTSFCGAFTQESLF